MRRSFLRNRKGDFEIEELAGIFLFVIIAVVAGFFIWKVVGYFSEGQEERNLEKTMTLIEERIKSVEEGKNVSFKLAGVCKSKECEWFVTGWGKNEIESPDVCTLKSCVCLCKGAFDTGLYASSDKGRSYCQSNGMCKVIDAEKVEVSGLSPEEATVSAGTWGSAKVKVQIPRIYLQSNLIEIKIDRNNGLIKLTKI